jgi:hypothetical protein
MRVGYHAIPATGVKWQRVGWEAIFCLMWPYSYIARSNKNTAMAVRQNYLNTAGVTLRTQSVSVVTMKHTRQCLLYREVWGSHTGADCDTTFLRRFVMPAGISLLVFRRRVLPSSSGRNRSEDESRQKTGKGEWGTSTRWICIVCTEFNSSY